MAKRNSWTVTPTTIALPKERAFYRTRPGRGRPMKNDRLYQAVEKERQKTGLPIRAIIRMLIDNDPRFSGRTENELNARYYDVKRALK
jgi:hypothetical protein